MKILTKIYQQNLDCRTELIEIDISEHGLISPQSEYLKIDVYLLSLVSHQFWRQIVSGKVKHESQVTSYEFKSTSYEFKSTNYEFKSTS